MPPEHHLVEVFLACSAGMLAPGKPRAHCGEYTSQMASGVCGRRAGEKDVWAPLLRLLPQPLDPDNEPMDVYYIIKWFIKENSSLKYSKLNKIQ